ncbi:C40 family peptidase [Streptomyces sp. SCA3-4]|uniref:C40 family peptidase n=1 Tax=Streptomyces sichuanensis TaxID=2871810 RepID=UPI001CE2F4E9|nr:C40 family peptidase [Streptomyces sichuanensis]MCA6095594.1 C40 family peptidase [Streptomyces sichuanensis]
MPEGTEDAGEIPTESARPRPRAARGALMTAVGAALIVGAGATSAAADPPDPAPTHEPGEPGAPPAPESRPGRGVPPTPEVPHGSGTPHADVPAGHGAPGAPAAPSAPGRPAPPRMSTAGKAATAPRAPTGAREPVASETPAAPLAAPAAPRPRAAALRALAAPQAPAVQEARPPRVAQAPRPDVERAVSYALRHVGDPYVYGGTGPRRWDCSGLVQQAYRRAGVRLPRVAADQYRATRHIPRSALRRGDLVFWSTNGRASGVHHVALYLGGGRYVEAARPGTKVRLSGFALYDPQLYGRPSPVRTKRTKKRPAGPAG